MLQNVSICRSIRTLLYNVAERFIGPESCGTSLIGKCVRDFFRTKEFIRIFDGFFLTTKGFLPKVYEILGVKCHSV